jgi:hypothetical protein
MNGKHQSPVWLAGFVLLAVGMNAVRAADDLPSLDKALRDNAPTIVKDLKAHEYRNVGVLKFTAQNGKGQACDNLGPINNSLADRLEVALVLALDDDSIGIVANATKGVADSGTGGRANHLEDTKRKPFFDINKKYFTVPWRGGEGVKPDAFLTGEVRLAPDRRSLEVVVQAFDSKESEKLRTVCKFKAATDLRTLTETGITFFARGAFDDPNALPQLIVKATKDAPQPDDSPATLLVKAEQALDDLVEKSPVKLEIRYFDEGDKKGVVQTIQAVPVSPEKSNVGLKVPTPKGGQRVEFKLENTTDETYGVVLKLNGLNTLYKQQRDAIDCKKWILKGKEKITIRGFQTPPPQNKYLEFVALNAIESDLNSVYYGENAGTINLVVFRSGKAPAQPADDVELAMATVSRGMLVVSGKPKASDLPGFQKQLKLEAGADRKDARKRGLITEETNKVGDSPVKVVEFQADPVPVVSATIRYYETRQK